MDRTLRFRLFIGLVALGLVSADDPPPPSSGAIFRDVKDRTPVGYRENAAYAELLRRARDTSVEELDRVARRDVLFADLATNPTRYRGVPIRIQGTATLVHALRDVPEPMAGTGKLYEAWVFPSDGRGFPVALVFEDLPPGLPLGDGVRAFVVFRGYFFKLMAYRAGDKPRFAPLLVGRVEFVPEPARRGPSLPTSGRSMLWYSVPLGVLSAYAVLRLVLVWQRGTATDSRPRRFGAPPKDSMTPDELEAWLNERPGDEDTSRNGDGERDHAP